MKTLACFAASLALCVSACTAAPTATPTPTRVPTITPTATATSFAPGVADFPYNSGEPAGEIQPAGQYKSPAWFSVPFTFETFKPYRGIGEELAAGEFFGIAEGRAMLPEKSMLFFVLDSTLSPETAIAGLRATKHVTLTDNVAVTLLGLPATQFDLLADQIVAIPAIGPFVGHTGDDWHTSSIDVRVRFTVLTVGDRTMLLYVETPAADFDAFQADMDQVLATVKLIQ